MSHSIRLVSAGAILLATRFPVVAADPPAAARTVVHYWASWCTPCKQQLPALRQVHEKFAGRGLATVGISVDTDDAAWQGVLKKLNLSWPQGRLTTAGESGVSSVPAYWLLDPAGKIVAKVYDPDELAKQLAERLK